MTQAGDREVPQDEASSFRPTPKERESGGTARLAASYTHVADPGPSKPNSEVNLTLVLQPPRRLAAQTLMAVVAFASILPWEERLLDSRWWSDEADFTPPDSLPELVQGISSPSGILVLLGALAVIALIQFRTEDNLATLAVCSIVSFVIGMKLWVTLVGHTVTTKAPDTIPFSDSSAAYDFENLNDFILDPYWSGGTFLEVVEFALIRPSYGLAVGVPAAVAATALILNEFVGQRPSKWRTQHTPSTRDNVPGCHNQLEE